MLTSIFKKDKVLYTHFFKIYDVKGRKMKLSGIVLFVLFIWTMINPAPSDYMASIKAKYMLHSTDNVFDYTVPLISAFMICLVFFNDYKNKTHEFLSFYNPYHFNYLVFYRWFMYVSIFSAGAFICGIFYYRHVAFMDGTSLLLSIRFLPNIFFLSALILCITALTKNNYTGLFVMLSYCIVDLLSGGRLFKIFSIGAHANNFYYSISPVYYIVNRIVITLIGTVLIYVGCKKSLSVRFKWKR